MTKVFAGVSTAALMALFALEAPAQEPEEAAAATEEQGPAENAGEPSSEAEPAAGEESGADTPPDEKELTEEEKEFKETGELKGDLQEDVDEALAGSSAAEQPGKTYLFAGARGRLLIIPQFMINLFAQGGSTIVTYGVGPEFGVRKDGFEYSFSVWYSDFGLNRGSRHWFRGNSDPDAATEIVHTSTWLLFVNADFMWSTEFTPGFALTYGAGVGLAPVFGDVFRTEAYPDPINDGRYLECTGPGNPNTTYCGPSNRYPRNNKEPGITDGGSVPPVFPWVTAQAGLRFKPHRNFVARLDLGFGTSGFFVGLGADYGI